MTARILIIDDDRDHADSVGDVLVARGYQVEIAHSGEAGVDRFRQADYDVTLMDVKLPGMNGLETLFEFRRIRPDPKIIMMTGFSVEHLLAQAIEDGALGVLHKPFAVADLLAMLERAKPRGLVVVADDDPDFATSIAPVLERNGYSVQVARTGQEALEKAQIDGIGCLILDLRMPVMSGLEESRPPRAGGARQMTEGMRELARPRRILVVDDDVDFAESLVDILEPHGYEIAIADRPETALAELSRAKPQVAMLDVRLKLASGVDLLSRLTGEWPDLICVMMTAHADTQTAIKALRNGAYDYVDKSAEPNQLLAMLDRCFEKLNLQEQSRAAHEALYRAKEEAEAASRTKSEFLATVSHELRTPLNAVIGFSEMMLSEIHGPLGQERYRGYIKDIYDSGTHLLDLINDILDLSKAAAGKIELKEEVLDPRDSIEAACRLVRPRAERADLTLAMSLPSALPRLRADRRMFKQILLNLLSNAVKFTPARGHIEVIASANERVGLTISVRDSGIGIAAEDVSKALEPFGQVESHLSRRHQGTGLGLPLAAAMVEQHGGELTLHTELGRGTTVVGTFPRERAIAASAAA